MSKTLLALYEDMPTAEKVLSDLQNAGFDPDTMSLIAHDAINPYTDPQNTDSQADSHEVTSSEGRNFGAIAGGLTGLLAGLIMIRLPELGPVVVAGPLATLLAGATGTLIGAGAGALTGGLSIALAEMNVPKHEADRFAERVLKGNVLVGIDITSQTVDRAIRIMSKSLPIDIQVRDSERDMSEDDSDPDDTVPLKRDVYDHQKIDARPR